MQKLTIATTQQQMRLFDSAESFRKELNRFLHMARAKSAELVVFPALAGTLAASHRVQGFQVGLLRQAHEARRGGSSLLTRARGSLAGSTAALFGANYRRAFVQLLQSNPAVLAETYDAVFSDLARAYEITVVAGSAYLADSRGIVRHRVTVFGPDGAALGTHDKMALSAEDEGLATPGEDWHVIATPVGRLGVLLGEEALYPEAGRVLAYQGADILVTLAATGDPALAAYFRQSTLAQAQENRVFGLTSFLIGKNYLAKDEASAAPFLGKSGIYAPLEMTPRYSGVLVEMGTDQAEGLLTAELDPELLRQAWDGGAEPVRRRMPVGLFASYLPALYSSRRALADVWPEPGIGAAGEAAAAGLSFAGQALALPAPTPLELGPAAAVEDGDIAVHGGTGETSDPSIAGR
jgi:predicted amidohydrolase